MNNQELHFQELQIVYSPDLHSNLVRLPSKVCHLLDQASIAVQEFGVRVHPDAYVGWDGQESKVFRGSSNVLEINPVLATEYKLQMGQLVDISIKRYGDESLVSEVHVEPQTFDDWETIDANAAFFQDQILYQTRLVKEGAKLLCFMQSKVCRFSIDSIRPDHLDVGRLTNDTLIIVAPKTREDIADVDDLLIRNSVPVIKRSLLSNEKDLAGIAVCLREAHHKHALVSVIHNPVEISETKHDKSLEVPDSIFCNVIQDPSLKENEIKISENLRRILGLSATNGFKIRIMFTKDPDSRATVILHPGSDDKKELPYYLEILDKLQVLTNNMTVQGEHPFTIEIKDRNSGKIMPFGGIPAETFIEIGETMELKKVDPIVLEIPNKVFGIAKLYEEIITSIKSPLSMSSSLLLQGGAGMGKSLVLKNLKQDLLNCGYHVKYVNCDSIPDSGNISKAKQYISELLLTAYWHSPSVILLDNADSVFSSIKSSDEQPSSSNFYSQNSTKLTQALLKEVNQITRRNGSHIKLVLAAKSLDSLNKLFSQKQFIGDMWSLKPPTRNQRNDMLAKFFEEKSMKLSKDLNITDVSLETEGYSAADLKLVVDRFFYDLLMTGESLILNRKLMEACLSNFTPASLRSVKLQKKTGVRWSDIGGLTKAKQILLETLEWPTKYAPIFAKSPLRLRSGILLYGYPGCGKTMLASAVAQQCGLNFISVKGPEILNKYIGASEQSVRDLFERAQAAKPCILFFDEFDSIAPKRGHDSTGVTDRVVNQMLTQMDGAEGLDGVYVLAATSRPDLIDSALLRPGRLDKSVICDIPDVAEREGILLAVTSKMDLEETCDLHEVAKRTEGFTGADLQGMSYNAYLKAVHRTLDSQNPTSVAPIDRQLQYISLTETPVQRETIESLAELLKATRKAALNGTANSKYSTNKPVISTEDMIAAAKEAKPSISPQELNKLTAIYTKFIGDREGKMPSGEASQEIGGRSTLA